MNTKQKTSIIGAFVAYHLAIKELMWDNPIKEKKLIKIAKEYGRDITTQEDLDLVHRWINLEQINKDLAQ